MYRASAPPGLTVAVATAALAMGLAPPASTEAGSAAPARPPAADTATVLVRIIQPSEDPDSWRYEPAELTVEGGTTVRWRNDGTVVHTVTADDGSFYSPNLGPGETWEWRFTDPGQYPYHCSPHPWMRGGVRVPGDSEEDTADEVVG